MTFRRPALSAFEGARLLASLGLMALALIWCASAALGAKPTEGSALETAQASSSRLGPPFSVRERAVLGADTAAIVVIEFSSFNCAHCRQFHESVFPLLRKEYVESGKVQWVIINTSNNPKDRTAPIFRAARSALRRGTYWSAVDSLFTLANLPEEELAADLQRHPAFADSSVTKELQDPVLQAAVSADFADYSALGIRGTPTFLLRRFHSDGRVTRGIIEDLQSPDYYRRTFEALLAKP